MSGTGKRTLAKRYGQVLEQTSQCARAMRDGDWAYLADQARQLEIAARDLAATAEVARRERLPAATADDVLALATQELASEVALALHPGRRTPTPSQRDSASDRASK